MSLRAELVRLCLPWFMRPRFPPQVQIEDVRRRMARFAHLIRTPPRGTEVIAVDAGGVKGERITTLCSLHNRYVLHLHGGAYLFGFLALFRDFTWRIAEAASARCCASTTGLLQSIRFLRRSRMRLPPIAGSSPSAPSLATWRSLGIRAAAGLCSRA